MQEPLELRTGEIGNGQKFLARAPLLPGYYTQVRFVLGNANSESASGGITDLTVEDNQVAMHLNKPLYIGRYDSQSLFLTLDAMASVDKDVFNPVIVVAPKLKSLIPRFQI